MRRWAACAVALFVMPMGVGSAVLVDPPTERHPGHTRWLALVAVNGDLVSNPPDYDVLTATYSDLAAAVDSRDVVHAVQVGPDPDPLAGGDVVLYMNTRHDTRRSNGFSPPLALALGATAETQPDIAVTPDDRIHVVWTSLDGQGQRHVYYLRKDETGWGPSVRLTPDLPPYIRAQSAVQSFTYSRPKLEVGSDGIVHFIAGLGIDYGQSEGDAYLVHGFLNGAVEMIPATLTGTQSTGSAIENWDYAIDPAGPLLVFWRETVVSGNAHFTASGTFQSWGSKVSFGYDSSPVVADLAIDSAGNHHFVWDDGVSIYYRLNSGTATTIPVNQPSNVSPRVGVDSRDQVHVLYTSDVGLSYAARIRNPDPAVVSASWATDYAAALPSALNLSLVTDLIVTENDRIHALSGNYYTRSMEYNLGVRDSAAAIGAFPGGAIDLSNGNLAYALTLFTTRGVDPTQSMAVLYNSLDPSSRYLGQGWSFTFDMSLVDHWSSLRQPGVSEPGDPPDIITVFFPTGRSIPFIYDESTQVHVAPDEYGFSGKLERVSSDRLQPYYKLTASSGGREFWFNPAGKIWRITEPTDNFLEIVYDEYGRMTKVIDQLGNGGNGRTTLVTYEPAGNQLYSPRIAEIEDAALSPYTFVYTGNHLTSVRMDSVNPVPVYGFEYSPANDPLNDERLNKLRTFRTPRGSDEGYGWTCRYLPDGRIVGVDDPEDEYLAEGAADTASPVLGVTTVSLVVDEPETKDETIEVQVVDRQGSLWVYKTEPRRALLREAQDPTYLAQTPGVSPVVRTFDAKANLTEVQDRWGMKTSFVYEQSSTPAYVRSNVKEVWRPAPTGSGQEKVSSFTYTGDTYNFPSTTTSYATPTGGSAPVARTSQLSYNTYAQLTEMLLPDADLPDGTSQQGTTKQYEYVGPRRQLTRTVDGEGNGVNYSNFCPCNGLARNITPDGGSQSWTSQCSTMGKPKSTTPPFGSSKNGCPFGTTTTCDGLQRPTRITKGPNVTNIAYDLDGNVMSVDPTGETPTTFAYDRKGNLKSVSGPNGTRESWVDPGGNVQRTKDSRGFETNFDWDALGRMTEVRTPGGSTVAGGGGGPATHTVRTNLDGFDGTNHFATLSQVSAGGDRVFKNTFDNRGRVRTSLLPDTQTKEDYTYDEQDQIVATDRTTSSGFLQSSVTYRDDRDRVTRIQIQDAPFGQAPSQESSVYLLRNQNGAVTTVVDPLGDVGAPSQAHKTTFLRDVRDRVTSVIDGTGATVRKNVWADDNRIEEVWTPDPVTKSTILTQAAAYSFGPPRKIYGIRRADGVLWRHFTYTHSEELNGIGTATGEYINYVRDPATGDITRSYDPVGTIAEYTWDKGFLKETKVHNPSGLGFTAVHTRHYDEAGRLEKLEAPLVDPEQYFYNDFGDLSQVVIGQKTVDYAYDSMGRLETATWSGSHTAQVTYAYDGDGALSSVTDGLLTREFTYDPWRKRPLDEVFKVSGTVWKTVTHDWDDAGNYASLLDPEGELHEYPVDDANRITEVKYKSSGVLALTYTPGGLIDTETLKDASGTAIATTTFEYDVNGRRIRSVTRRESTGEVLADYGWEYDDNDKITKLTLGHLGIEATYAYDLRGRLKTETLTGNGDGQTPPPFTNTFGDPATGNISTRPEILRTPNNVLGVSDRTGSYTYDKGGNRLTKTVGSETVDYTYNEASQLTDQTNGTWTITHTYDAWGNEITRTTVDGGTTVETYGYDHRNLLSTYSNDSSGADWQIDYWPTGERYAKTDLDTSDKELYVPVSGNVSAEYDQPSGQSIALLNTYVQGLGLDAKFIRVNAAGVRRHLLGDQVGTLGRTLDDTGADIDTILKDSFGVTLAGSTVEPFAGLAGLRPDAESGLSYVRNRMYDPASGRFTQTDPLRGNRPTDHYVYGSSSPLNRVDPLGLDDDVRQQIIRGAERIFTAVNPVRGFLDALERYGSANQDPSMTGLGESARRARRVQRKVSGFDSLEVLLYPERLLEPLSRRFAGPWPLTRDMTVTTAANHDLLLEETLNGIEEAKQPRGEDRWEDLEDAGILLGTMAGPKLFLPKPTAGACKIPKIRRVSAAKAASKEGRYHNVGPGHAVAGEFFSDVWIKRSLYGELQRLVGAADKAKFVAAMKKGIVGPTGESGIKILRSPVNGYTHELKIGGSAQRLLGKIEHGNLIFRHFVRGGLH